jgi:hypothetical protein
MPGKFASSCSKLLRIHAPERTRTRWRCEQRFAGTFRGGGESPPQLANDMSEHETDLFRDQPNGEPLS